MNIIRMVTIVLLFSFPLLASSEFLLEAADLRSLLGKIIVLDTRPRVDYDKEHIPGARWIDRESMVKYVNEKNTASLSEYLRSLGLKLDSSVLSYDGGEMENAAQTAWMLEYTGFKDVRLLNGGIYSWKEESKFPIESKIQKHFPPARFSPRWNQSVFASMSDVKQNLKSVTMIDTRSEAEHKGKEVRAKRGGTIPGAKHRNWILFIDPIKHRFRSSEEITKAFSEAGIDPQKPAIVFCQTGRRSSVVYFALKLLGNHNVKNYFASWKEWGNSLETRVQ